MKDCTEKEREKFFMAAIEYILNEAHLHPNDSLVDIANEALEDLNMIARWGADGQQPILVESGDVWASIPPQWFSFYGGELLA